MVTPIRQDEADAEVEVGEDLEAEAGEGEGEELPPLSIPVRHRSLGEGSSTE